MTMTVKAARLPLPNFVCTLMGKGLRRFPIKIKSDASHQMFVFNILFCITTPIRKKFPGGGLNWTLYHSLHVFMTIENQCSFVGPLFTR